MSESQRVSTFARKNSGAASGTYAHAGGHSIGADLGTVAREYAEVQAIEQHQYAGLDQLSIVGVSQALSRCDSSIDRATMTITSHCHTHSTGCAAMPMTSITKPMTASV